MTPMQSIQELRSVAQNRLERDALDEAEAKIMDGQTQLCPHLGAIVQGLVIRKNQQDRYGK